MVRHDMAAAKAKLTSEQLRLAWGLLTPAEREAQAKAEEARAEKAAKEQTKGVSLFGDEK